MFQCRSLRTLSNVTLRRARSLCTTRTASSRLLAASASVTQNSLRPRLATVGTPGYTTAYCGYSTVPQAGLAATDIGKLPPKVLNFVQKAIELCKPDAVHLCDGSAEENQQLMDLLVSTGTVQPLAKRPGCYAARSDPADVARSMGDTYTCSVSERDCGPINNWKDPTDMKEHLSGLFDGCMKGRTMYIVPFGMGPLDSPLSKLCVQVTDSAYVVVNLRITTRMGDDALSRIEERGNIELMHTVGCPVAEGETSATWPCNIPKRKIVQFPETREVWSFGSGYGGNALLGKKCVALRIASVQARDEGWLAEHMLILGITNPAGVKRYICAAFPSACGKTNLAMLQPSVPGWKVETVGDDIAWLRFDENGQMRAINPENGFFGVATGTSTDTNPHAMKTIETNSLFTNVGVTDDGDVFWEGLGDVPESPLTDWKGNAGWTPTLTADGKVDKKTNPCAHPNSRFTTPLSQCPVLDEEWNSPEGVPIDAIVFGVRRDDTQPLVYQSFDWDHGVFVGATMRSNATAAAEGKGLESDPMAMKPFIGYNVKDYFANWLNLPARSQATVRDGVELQLPKIFHTNWFALDDSGGFIWPGYAENCRVLDWILQRCAGEADAITTPIGNVPVAGAIQTSDMDGFSEEALAGLLSIDREQWIEEAADIRKYFDETLMKGDDTAVPQQLYDQLDALEARLKEQ